MALPAPGPPVRRWGPAMLLLAALAALLGAAHPRAGLFSTPVAARRGARPARPTGPRPPVLGVAVAPPAAPLRPWRNADTLSGGPGIPMVHSALVNSLSEWAACLFILPALLLAYWVGRRSLGTFVNRQEWRAAYLAEATGPGSFQGIHHLPLGPLRASVAEPTPMPAAEVRRGAILLKTKDLSKAFSAVPQFEKVDMLITQGQRIGLLGINGAGKSTFMRCLAGLEGVDGGLVEVAAGCRVLYVDQEPDWENPDRTTLKQALFSAKDDPRARAILDYYQAMESGDADAMETSMNALQAQPAIWDFENNALDIAAKFGLGPDMYDVPVSRLSGGQKKRLGLAASLALQPDVVLLDEPTNHLDTEGIEYLIDFLNGSTRTLTVMLVTHDRYLIQRTCDQIMELDRSALNVYPVGSSYDKYLELRAERIAAADATAQAARVKLRREAEWMRKQPKARATKAQARIDAFGKLQETAKGRGADPAAVTLATKEEAARQKRLGGVVAECKGATVSVAGRTLVSGFTYDFRQRDRVGLVGPNGAGKTTFLRALLQLEPLAAGSIRLGETVQAGYFEQAGLQLDEKTGNMTVLKFVQEAVEASALGESMGEQEAMRLLNRFSFPAKRWNDKVAFLSGGEMRRLQLLKVLAPRPNFLVLDEPTNDLDLSTVQALETFLTEGYEGAVIIVSHDRYFMDRVADHLFAIEADAVVRNYTCSFSDYVEAKLERERQEASQAAAQTAVASKTKPAVGAAKPGLTREQRKEMDRLESQIERLNAKLETWNEKLSATDGSEDYNELAKWMGEVAAIKDQIAEKEERWMELSELAEG
eukprot:EG_transcript_2947